MSSSPAQAYIALARKWRPAQFSDIVGQGPIVRTLMNAIRTDRVHPAYLMTGSRGIGKTSIARILAKAVRCESSTWSGTAPNEWLKSCGTCASCKEITSGTSVDVIEIDGASNNGVDAVREIRENAKYLPATGSRKIYIIDEVHMLTTAAFNALLKTIEEPPPHVIFVFATTEPHKIPSTILSRCQRFDLRRVTAAQVQTRVAEVIESEKIAYEPGALALIGRASEGSMRDALSLLDQVIAFSGQKITTQSVRESIGLIEGQTLTGILRAIFSGKPLEGIALVDQAYQQGHDLRVLTRGLIEFLHASILAKLGTSNVATLELSEDEWKELLSIVPLRSLEEMELFFQVLHHGLDWIARSPQPKLVLDVLIVKCATAETLSHVDQTRGGSGSPSQSGRTAAPQSMGTPRSTAAFTAPEPVAPVVHAEETPAYVSAPVAPALSLGNESQASVDARGASATQVSASFASLAAALNKPSAPAPATSQTQAAPAPSAAPGAPLVKAYTGPAEQAWEALIAAVRQTRPLLASILEHGTCDHLPGQPAIGTIEEDVLAICFRPEDAYFREQLQARSYSEQLQQFGRDFFGRTIRTKVDLREMGETLAQRRERERTQLEKNARSEAQNHPIIAEAKALFGGELSPIELLVGRDGGNTGGKS